MTNGLLCIGDNVVDLYLDRGVFFPGGNALNVAVLARRFGLADVVYMGIVGNDREGDHVRTCMAAEGLSIAHLRRVEGPNGKAQVTPCCRRRPGLRRVKPGRHPAQADAQDGRG